MIGIANSQRGNMMKKLLCGLGLAVLCSAGTSLAADPAWPTRPVRVIVPFAPGGTTDVIARLISARMTELTGQQFIVDNRAGAGSNIGTGIAANAAPDGQTILVSSSAYVVNPGLYKSIPYDPFKSFETVTNFAASPNVFTVHPSVPVKTMAEMLKLTATDLTKYSFATPGIGTTPHLAVEMLKYAIKLDIGNIPYNGAGPSVAAHLGGQVLLSCAALPTPAPHIKAGRMRGIAMASPKRAANFPDIPTMAESGYKDQESNTLQGVYFPAGTHKSIVTRFHAELMKMAQIPAFRERVLGLGFEFVLNTPQEFEVQVREEVNKWTRVVKNSKIQVN